jgi:hypothetical protein
MKKIFLSIVLLITSSIYVFSAEREVYCFSPSSGMVFKHTDFRENPTTPFCQTQIPRSVYDKIDRENDDWFQKGSVKDPDAWIFSSAPLGNNPKFIQQRRQAIENIYNQSKDEILAFNKAMEIDFQKNQNKKIAKENEINEKQKVSNLLELERKHSTKCNIGYVKGSDKHKNCLIEQENKLIVEKNKSDLEAKQVSEKLAKMNPDDRRAYTCSEKFGFRKGSDKFKDCVFKIYSAEIELEKLELQKQLAKANADLARANSDRQDRLAQAQTETARMQAYAAQQQAIAANTADSLALMESGLRMMSPQRPAPRMQTSCTYVGRFLNCF